MDHFISNEKISDLILYKDNQIIAFNKPPGLSVQPDKSEGKSLLDFAEIYCKKRVYLINRLDRPASGIVLFAKHKPALEALNEQFRERRVKKTYLAVVKNRPKKNSGKLVHHIRKKQEINRSFVFEKMVAYSQEAELSYLYRQSIDRYHLLEIDLITGRHHQIRAQLAAIGCPIKGDVKYGFKRSNPERSIHLHAWKLEFFHPVSQALLTVKAPPPDEVVWNAFEIEEKTIQNDF